MAAIVKKYLIPRYIKDFLWFFPQLMIAALVAVRIDDDMLLFWGIVANYLLMFFSFLFNDIEDREDDAASPGKRFRNPFGYKEWSLGFGYGLLFVAAVIALYISYQIGGQIVFLIALSNLVIGIFYSWKSLRLKGFPIVDLLSHAYLLAAVEVLYFIALPGAIIDQWTILILLGAFLFSAGGDLDNEYRDFEEDREAGLRNTASYLGKRNTILMSRSAWVVAFVLLVAGFAGALINLIY